MVYSVPSYYTSAYAQQYNLTVQHEIAPWQMLLKVGYVGNLGRRLGSTYDYNQPEPGLGTVASRRPFGTSRPRLTGVNFAVSDGLSNYNALQVSADKRFSHGFTMLLAYTWAHAIDNVGTEFGAAPELRRTAAAAIATEAIPCMIFATVRQSPTLTNSRSVKGASG